jgi:predicted GNAT family acetyltransferase
VDGELAGFSRYQRQGDAYALTHTEVDDRFEGQGVGSDLVRTVLDRLRDAGASMFPYCPFVRAYVQRHPEYLVLVPAELRERFELPV